MADEGPQNKRREKPVLSCSFCRGRKEEPCGACKRRGKAHECVYITSEQQRRVAVDYRPRARASRAHQRLAHLEKLVTEMRDQEQPSQQSASHEPSLNDISSGREPSQAPSESATVANMGTLSLTDSHTVYIGRSHWVAVLDDIRKLKEEMDTGIMDADSGHEVTTPDTISVFGQTNTRISLLASATCFPREQILAMVPPRKIVDRLISYFFNSFDYAPLILHRNTFLAEYASFWANPEATGIIWLGLLFSIMSMSKFLQKPDVGPSGLSDAESQDTLETYRTLTIHCLIAGDYMQPSRYTIETLTLHFVMDQQVGLDTHMGGWALMGVIIRIAFRVGLHRDPSHWPTIRPLQAELRRRLWMTLYQMDFFTSTQVGLPRLIKDSQCDTKPPLNLLEQDLLPEYDSIPEERPTTELTSMMYLIQRYQLVKISAEIYDATEGDAIAPSTIAALEVKLKDAISAVPECLKIEAMLTSVADDPETILHRGLLDMIKNKALYLLHRQNFMQDVAEGDSANSTMQCVNAALAILNHQRRLSEEIQPGGLLYGIRWKVANSLNHEFLQATMMLCSVLGRFNERSNLFSSSETQYKREEILEALRAVLVIWEKDANQSIEAQKAVDAVQTALNQESSALSARDLKASYFAFSGMSETFVPGYFGEFDCEPFMNLDYSMDADLAAFGGSLD